MAAVKARLKHTEWEVWQYDADLRPPWVASCTEWHSDGLYLVRRSGKQRVEHKDWLIRNLDDRDPDWVTDAEFVRSYDLDE
jgi:hypothetical protein